MELITKLALAIIALSLSAIAQDNGKVRISDITQAEQQQRADLVKAEDQFVDDMEKAKDDLAGHYGLTPTSNQCYQVLKDYHFCPVTYSVGLIEDDGKISISQFTRKSVDDEDSQHKEIEFYITSSELQAIKVKSEQVSDAEQKLNKFDEELAASRGAKPKNEGRGSWQVMTIHDDSNNPEIPCMFEEVILQTETQLVIQEKSNPQYKDGKCHEKTKEDSHAVMYYY